MIIQRNSPPFSRLIFWINRKNIEKLQKFFPLKDENTWVRVKHKKFYTEIDLSKKRNKIYSNLIDPLFIKSSINIRNESNPSKHREDNLYCCFEMALRELKRGRPWEQTLKRLRSDCKIIAPPAFRPLSWMLDSPEEHPETERSSNLEAKWKELYEERNRINKRMGELSNESLLISGWRRKTREMEEVDKRWLHAKRKEEWKIDAAISSIDHILDFLKTARGKSGRHPKPFNVFVYHLINSQECTSWKYDENHRHVLHEDGRHKLERDRSLILYLLLDTHLNVIPLPELKEFISKNKKAPTYEALKALKTRLWNTYKNFPPLEGWSFPRKTYETGFRKLIVNDDGRLEIVRL